MEPLLKLDFMGHPISTWNDIPFALSVKQYCQSRVVSVVLMMNYERLDSILTTCPEKSPCYYCDCLHSSVSTLTSDTVLTWVYTQNSRMPWCRSFNHVPMTKTNAQYADCPTRQGKTLDLFYASVKDGLNLPPPPLLTLYLADLCISEGDGLSTGCGGWLCHMV